MVKNPPANAGGVGWIPGQGTKIPHVRGNQAHVAPLPSLHAATKTLHAATKAQHRQIKDQQKPTQPSPPGTDEVQGGREPFRCAEWRSHG